MLRTRRRSPQNQTSDRQSRTDPGEASASDAGVDAKSASAPASGESHLQILKSTAVIGASSVINIGFAVVRNKAAAVLLGPDGVGLLGLYGSVVDLAQTLAGLGIQESGVRQIALAVGRGDAERIARTALVLKRLAIVLGIVGAVALAAGAGPISSLTFGDSNHVVAVAMLSVALFLRLAASGQVALVQGMRRIADQARISIIGAFCSTIIAVPMFWWFGADGVAPSLVLMAAATLLVCWWFARRIRVEPMSLSLAQVGEETSALFRLGIVFMASAFLSVGSMYAVRLIILRNEGFIAAGLYQAAWAIGGLYAGFILQAMGTDFFPRLTAISQDNAACNQLVNEQSQVSILLAGPGVLATLTVAPLVIRLFYTADFQPAVELLRWICLGMMLRVVSWPMGFIILAKGARRISFWVEVSAAAVHVALAFVLVPWLGLIGSGIAFFSMYIWHTLVVYAVARKLSDFRLSRENLYLWLIFMPTTAIVFVATQVLPFWHAAVIGGTLTVVTGLYAVWMLLRLIPAKSLPKSIRRFAASRG